MRNFMLRCKGCGLAALIVLLAGFAAGCHSGAAAEAITLAPGSDTVALQGTVQFSASVTGATDTTVTWQVNMITGGNSTCGTISTTGLYTAPNAIPNSTLCGGTTAKASACTTTTNATITLVTGCILITAVSNQNNTFIATGAITVSSGVAISISRTGPLTAGTSETLQIQATVTGTTNLTVNWLVNNVPGGDLTTTGSITATTIGDGTLANAATFTAPTMIPTPATVTIEGQAAADTTQFQTVSLTVVLAADPTLTSVSPLNAPAGAYAQDYYLSGANFLSTTSVLFSGVNVGNLTGGSVTAVNGTLIRAHVPSSATSPFGPLANAGTFTVAAQRENGDTTPALTVNLVPVRPVLLGATSSGSLIAGATTTTLELDGGYYTPSTVIEFNGHLVGTSQDFTFPRTLQGILNTSDLAEAGLFPIAVRTPGATPPRSAINLPIRSSAAPAVANKITGFKKPVAVALNDVTGVPVVVDQAMNAVDLLDTGFTKITSSVTVGTSPTSVAVDGLRNFALVADNGSSDVAVVDLSVPALASTLSLKPALSNPPVAVGVDEIHGRAIVVGQAACPSPCNVPAAVVLDTSGAPAAPPVVLGTVAVVTGTQPQVTVLPDLGWAIITPGGAGQLTVVDLVRLSVVFSSTLNSTLRGVGVNSQTKTLILADPTTPFNSIFSLADQSISTVSLDLGSVAAAANPLTNVGILLNPNLRVGFELDLNTPAAIAVFPLGSDPIAVAVDPGSDKALVVDDVDATVTVIDMGATRSRSGEPQIVSVSRSNPATIATAVEAGNTVTITTTTAHGLTTGDAVLISGVGVAGYNVSPPITPTFVVTVTSPTQFTYTNPTASLTASGGGIVVGPATPNAFVSGNPVPLVILGAGFSSSSQIRVNETPIPTTFVPSRPGELTGSIPANLLTQPVRLVVDVLNPGNLFSNVSNLLIGQPIAVGNSPLGVAIGSIVLQTTPPTELELALVANSTDGTVSVVDINPASTTFSTVTSLITVGSTPVDVAIVSRNGLAAVSNSGSSTASIVDLTTNPITVPATVSVGADPTGVAVSQSLGSALVTNTSSNSVSLIPLSTATGSQPGNLAVDAQPDASAIAPDLNISVVANAAANSASLLNVVNGTPSFINRVSNITSPTGVDYDPVTQDFLILSSASNSVTQLNVTPTGSNTFSLLQSSIRVGINPTSLVYDFQSGTLLTLNTASNTLSVVDLAKCAVTTASFLSCTTTSGVRDVLPISGTVQYALALHPWLGYFVLSDSANNRIVILPSAR